MKCRFLLLLLAAALTSPASAALRAWVDNPQVPPGETVELTLARDGQTGSQPDLTPLQQDFNIIGRSSSTNLQIVNGKASAITQLTLTLAPKHAGKLTIPSVTWETDRSPPLSLEVTASSNGSSQSDNSQSAAGNRVFLETEVDPKSPYLQAAVHVTVRVFAAVPLSQAGLELPTTDTALARQVGSDTSSTSQRNGQSYQVVTRHYLLFPQKSGSLTLPGPALSGNIPAAPRRGNPNDPFSGMFGGSPFGGMMAAKPIRLNSEPIVLDVRPRPSGAGATYWLPAHNVSLTAQWRTATLQAHVGDPITVNLHLQAEDLTAAQLPDLSTLLELPDGLKAYPDEPKLKDIPQGAVLVADREQNIALIAEQPGQFTIPEVRLSWWDTQTNQAREATIPAQTLVVQPAAGSTIVGSPTPIPAPQATAPTPASTQSTPPVGPSKGAPGQLGTLSSKHSAWPWISLAFALLWIATLTGWFLSHRRARARASLGATNSAHPSLSSRTPAPNTSAARAAFLASCKSNDALGARRNLLLWANALAPDRPIPGLGALAKRVQDSSLTALLRALDRACYADDTWNGTALAAALQQLPLQDRRPEDQDRELAPLYR